MALLSTALSRTSSNSYLLGIALTAHILTDGPIAPHGTRRDSQAPCDWHDGADIWPHAHRFSFWRTLSVKSPDVAASTSRRYADRADSTGLSLVTVPVEAVGTYWEASPSRRTRSSTSAMLWASSSEIRRAKC